MYRQSVTKHRIKLVQTRLEISQYHYIIVFKVITAPFKKEFLDAFAEFLMGLVFGATIYLAIAAFADDTTIWRIGGAVLGFVATLSFLVYAIAYG